MIIVIIVFFRSIIGNDYLTLYLISIIPIIELRGAILFMPYMFDTIGEMLLGMLCCVAGSTTVIIPLILLTKPIIRRLKRTKLFKKIAKNMEANLNDRAQSAYNEEKKNRLNLSADAKKSWGTFIFVAIPLPMTGAWTGSCIASMLEFPLWKASLSVFAGNIVAGLILTMIAYFLPSQYADIFLYGFVVLAIAIAIVLYFTRSHRKEKKIAQEQAKYSTKSEYELALLERDASESGEILIKKEYIDENGDRHIVIGKDEKRNNDLINNHDEI